MSDFEFDGQHDLIAQTARDFFGEHMPLTRVREVEESELGWVHTSTVRGYSKVPMHFK